MQYWKTIQQEWRSNVSVLSDLSVAAVSPGDFLSTTEALAKESLTKCREALGELNFEKLTSEISLLVGISEKAVHVCGIELQGAADPLIKSRLAEVTSRVNSGRTCFFVTILYICYTVPYRTTTYHNIPYYNLTSDKNLVTFILLLVLVLPELASLSTEVICNIQDSRNHVKFIEQAMVLVDKLGEMRSIVKRSPVHLKGNGKLRNVGSCFLVVLEFGLLILLTKCF